MMVTGVKKLSFCGPVDLVCLHLVYVKCYLFSLRDDNLRTIVQNTQHLPIKAKSSNNVKFLVNKFDQFYSMAENTTKFTSILEEESLEAIARAEYLYEAEKEFQSSIKDFTKEKKMINQKEARNVDKLDNDGDAFETAKEFDQVDKSGKSEG